jgi:GntR family transcriptional repressor for pyruvate dehydrogenase complex
MDTHRTLTASGDIPVAAQTRASDIAERYLRSLIFSGQLAPGDRLPPERELAAQLGISRITLRVALRSLEAVGFLVIKLGSKGGSRVNDAASITLHWEEWMQTHRDQLSEMLEFRRLVETTIASLAAERRTSKDLKMLEAAGGPRDEKTPPLVRWHVGFHDALAIAAHNRYLEQSMVAIRGELFVPVEWVLSEPRIGEVETVHDRILEAVRAGDPVKAAEEMGAHLDFSEKPFNKALRRRIHRAP